MKTRLPILSIALVALVGVTAPLGAQADTPEKKSKKGAAAGAEAAEGGASAVEIDWDGTKLRGQQIIKRLYRLKKSNQWAPERLPKLCQLVLDTGYQPFFKYAKFYQALIAGHDGQNAEALKLLKEAVALGYKNATEIGEAAELAALQENPEFKALLTGLEKELRERQVRNFTGAMAKGLELGLAAPPFSWSRGLQTIDGKPFWIEGQPMIVVVSKLDDDRLERYIPMLRSIKLPAPLGVVLYDYFPKGPARIARFAGKLGLDGAPLATVPREDYLKLRPWISQHFENAQQGKERFDDEEEEVFRELLPFTVLFDATRRPVHSLAGIPDRWELEIALAQIEGVLPRLPPPTAEEAPEPPPAVVDPPKPAEPAADTPKPEEPKPGEPAPETPKPESPTPPGEAKPVPLPPPEEPKPEEPKKPTETPSPTPLEPQKPQTKDAPGPAEPAPGEKPSR